MQLVTLLCDLRTNDPKAHHHFCRMGYADYQELLVLVSPYITYK